MVEVTWGMSNVISALVGRVVCCGAAVFSPAQGARPHCGCTYAWAPNNFARAIHKLDNVNRVVSCAVFFFSPR